MASDVASRKSHKKASFHLPTETNPNPADNDTRYSLNDEINTTIAEIEDRWEGSSFEGFCTSGVGSYRMRRGELKDSKVVDIYRRFFVVFDPEKIEEDLAFLKDVLERFRKKTDKNNSPIQESIYLEIEDVEVHFIGEPAPPP